MTGRFKLLLSLIIVLIIFFALQYYFFTTHRSDVRKDTALMNQYYSLSKTDPLAAKRALVIIINQDPKNKLATRELAYWYLKNGDMNQAIPWFQKALENDPDNQKLAFELGKLYLIADNYKDATHMFSIVVKLGTEPLATEAREMLTRFPTMPAPVIAKKTTLATPTKPTTTIKPTIPLKTIATTPLKLAVPLKTNNQHQKITATKITTVSARDKMLNEFYEMKKKNSPNAWNIIRQGANAFPNDIQILKEAGYYALLTLHNKEIALIYFNRVYQLTNDPKIALQIAYLYDGLGQRKMAYHYFDLATNTTDLKDRKTAEIAKSNLRGIQTKFLPYPFEATLDYSPLYMSRFKLLIQPYIFHLGLTLNQLYHWKIYFSYRRTSDDRSNTNNLVSSIYEDDAAITALGTSLTPFKTIPQLVAFTELGKAVDLVYRNRSRWRTDFRAGVAYYNDWGFNPDYTFKPTFMLKPNADLYTDLIYYTRYIDTIGTFRLRPGIKVFRWGSTSIDLYYKFFFIEDKARQFYNNVFENGPGFALRFSDRYNIVLRCEQLTGYYLPAGSPTPNPYGPHYHNTVTMLNTYFEF